MERLALFMEKYGLLIFLALYIIFYIYVRNEYKNVGRYYIAKDYQKCQKTINFLSHFPKNKLTRQYLCLYKALILLVEDNFTEAGKNLNILTSKRYIGYRLFWECYIRLRAGDISKAKDIFNEYEKVSDTQSSDYQLLSILLKIIQGEPVDKKIQDSFIDKIKHPRFREFYLVAIQNTTQ